MAKSRYQIKRETEEGFIKVCDKIYDKHKYWVSYKIFLSKQKRKKYKKKTPKKVVNEFFKKHNLKSEV